METFDYYFSIVKNSRSYSVWVLAEKLDPRWVVSVRIVSPSGNDVAWTDFSRSSLKYYCRVNIWKYGTSGNVIFYVYNPKPSTMYYRPNINFINMTKTV